MRTLIGLSGEYVTFDQNIRKCNFVKEFLLEHLAWKIDGFNEIATLFEQLNESGRVSFN